MLSFEHQFATLPEPLWMACQPTPVSQPTLIAFNERLAETLGVKTGLKSKPDDATLAQWFSGNQLPPGAEPRALGYAGHQFGNFVPQLGDGRALLLGRSSTRMAYGATFSSRAAGARHFPVVVMVVRRWGRCCGSIWSVNLWLQWAYPPPVR